MSQINVYLVLITSHDTRRLLVSCERFHREVSPKKNSNQTDKKNSIRGRRLQLKFFCSIEFSSWIELHIVVLTLDYIKCSQTLCKSYRMKVDLKQGIQSEPKKFKLTVLVFIELFCLGMTSIWLCLQWTRQDVFLFICKHYHMQVNPKKKLHSETKHSIGDKRLKLNFWYPIESFVLD